MPCLAPLRVQDRLAAGMTEETLGSIFATLLLATNEETTWLDSAAFPEASAGQGADGVEGVASKYSQQSLRSILELQLSGKLCNLLETSWQIFQVLHAPNKSSV